MDILFEVIVELFLEGGLEIVSHKKISKWIRYPILFLLILFFNIVLFGLLCAGILSLKENIIVGLFFIGISLFLLIGTIIKFKNTVLKVREDHK